MDSFNVNKTKQKNRKQAFTQAQEGIALTTNPLFSWTEAHEMCFKGSN